LLGQITCLIWLFWSDQSYFMYIWQSLFVRSDYIFIWLFWSYILIVCISDKAFLLGQVTCLIWLFWSYHYYFMYVWQSLFAESDYILILFYVYLTKPLRLGQITCLIWLFWTYHFGVFGIVKCAFLELLGGIMNLFINSVLESMVYLQNGFFSSFF